MPNVTDSATPDANETGEQWDDAALAATLRKGTAVASTNTAELLDMKSLDLKRSEQGDIAEKLRVEETKAQLAAAKAGMEAEAQRLKEEREKKGQQKEEAVGASKPRFGAAAAGMVGGGKWVPPHMRGSGGLEPTRFGMGMGMGMGGSSNKVDTQDETLFPDLAAADALLKQKQDDVAYKAPKKTPVGGGATWGNRPKLNLKKPEKKPEDQPEPEEEPTAEPEPVSGGASPEPAEKTREPVAAPAPAVAPIKPKKKKKKDLSTFGKK